MSQLEGSLRLLVYVAYVALVAALLWTFLPRSWRDQLRAALALQVWAYRVGQAEVAWDLAPPWKREALLVRNRVPSSRQSEAV